MILAYQNQVDNWIRVLCFVCITGIGIWDWFWSKVSVKQYKYYLVLVCICICFGCILVFFYLVLVCICICFECILVFFTWSWWVFGFERNTAAVGRPCTSMCFLEAKNIFSFLSWWTWIKWKYFLSLIIMNLDGFWVKHWYHKQKMIPCPKIIKWYWQQQSFLSFILYSFCYQPSTHSYQNCWLTMLFSIIFSFYVNFVTLFVFSSISHSLQVCFIKFFSPTSLHYFFLPPKLSFSSWWRIQL